MGDLLCWSNQPFSSFIFSNSTTNPHFREIKQKNEGGWEFYWDEESRPGVVVLEVRVQKFLDSSLIDVDVHPTYVSMVIKSKVRHDSLLRMDFHKLLIAGSGKWPLMAH